MNDYSLDDKRAFPWSLDTVGWPAFAVVAALLVLFTIWTYIGHPQATRRRVMIVLALRLAALAIALLTAVRPMVETKEYPKTESHLLIGVDMSESMTTADEVGDQPRALAVRKALEKCQPTLDALAERHQIKTVMYRFGPTDFNVATFLYDPNGAADAKRSDYGTYLNRTNQQWQIERVRMHLVVGDGADNGDAFTPVEEARPWGRRGVLIHTFLVGRESSGTKTQDLIVSNVEVNPSPAFIKTTAEVSARVHAYGFRGTTPVTARVFLNDKPVVTENVTLTSELGDDGKGNKITIRVPMPEQRGEYKVKVQVGNLDPKTDTLVKLPGELTEKNNWAETYLTVTKEGVKVLIVDQARFELTGIRDALRDEKRFDVYEVIRQADLPPTGSERELLNLDLQSYDVVIIGNVKAADLARAVPDFFPALAKMVKTKGTGVMFLGGEHAFVGVPADVLPVTGGAVIDKLHEGTGTPTETYPTVPTPKGLEKMFRTTLRAGEMDDRWDRMNSPKTGVRLSGFNELIVSRDQQILATVYAWTVKDPRASPKPDSLDWADVNKRTAFPLLIGSQRGDKDMARWLAFGAFDTYLWRTLDALEDDPEKRTGIKMHEQFWRQCVLWLAHQDEEESQVFVRPKKRLMKAGDEQTIRVGVKLPNGQDDPKADVVVRIVPLAPGQLEPKPEDEAKATPSTLLADAETADGKGRKVLFRPSVPGEYYVVATAPGKDPSGKPVVLRGWAKFIVEGERSDEMLQIRANPTFLRELSSATGGEAKTLEDLPGFLEAYLQQLDADPRVGEEPKTRHYPDWNRNRSREFLSVWLVLFVLLLGGEWALRRLWGMV